MPAPTAPKYVKCLRSGSRVVKDKVYEVVDSDSGEYYIRDGKSSIGWCLASYFIAMPPTYDPMEEKLRAVLIAPTQSCSCRKCGAPRPCEYHG